MVSAHAIILCALPGIALYRMSTSVSRGMKVMQHDIYSRGITEPIATTLAFLITFVIGFKKFATGIGRHRWHSRIWCGRAGLRFQDCSDALRPRTAARPSKRRSGNCLVMQLRSAPISCLTPLFPVWMSSCSDISSGAHPGVTLATVGIYGAAVEIANGLRKLNQTFNPDLRSGYRRNDRDGRS